MIQVFDTQTFSAKIEEFVKAKRCDYIDAICHFCKENGIEVETGAKLINKIIKDKVQAEASERNLLKQKSAKLPF